MPLMVIVGGQYGSEGKGKATAVLATRRNADIVVRCGSTNSGHTVWHNGRCYQLRLVPTGFISPTMTLMLAPGSLIDLAVLRKEVSETGVARERLIVDRNAGVIEESDIAAERSEGMQLRIGSTQSGVGSAVARRVLRGSGFRCAYQVTELQEIATVGDVSGLVNDALLKGANVLIEGTQGYGLYLYHTPVYPYATSRDTTTAGFLSEVGVGPRMVDEVIMAVRTFPIRVGGNSGPLLNETSWEAIQRESGYPHAVHEYTTTTHRLRRVARFDMEIVKRAARVNSATAIALHGADYLDYANVAAGDYEELTPETRDFVESLESELEIPVTLIGTGPLNEQTIERIARRSSTNLLGAPLHAVG